MIYLYFLNFLHYIIGLIIVFLLVWLIIKTHLYFSKDNK
jgi:hypothetical protein